MHCWPVVLSPQKLIGLVSEPVADVPLVVVEGEAGVKFGVPLPPQMVTQVAWSAAGTAGLVPQMQDPSAAKVGRGSSKNRPIMATAAETPKLEIRFFFINN